MTEIDKISNTFSETEELLDKLEEYIDNNIKISLEDGAKKSLQATRRYFKVDIPQDINFLTLAATAREISKKYQEASYYRDKQAAKLAIIEQTRETEYEKVFNQVRKQSFIDQGKYLAAESCKVAATLATKNLDSTVSTQKVIHNFWDGICKTLIEVRKHCEMIGIALSGDAKIQRDFIIKGESKQDVI